VSDAEYEISTDPERLDVEAIVRLLHTTYWAEHRPREVIEKSIRHSLCFGLYWRGTQVGFGRVVTDWATFAWICDVIIDAAHRGGGLGKRFVEEIVTHPEIADIRQLLATRDAHTLYEKFGFERIGEFFLGRKFVLVPGADPSASTKASA
jgi:N-acetylglutamate synthase-like GNAT family acetyltransferase